MTASWPLAKEYGCVTYAEGFSTTEDVYNEALAAEAMKTAADADKIVVYAGLPDSFESEGYDRSHMRLPECQNRLIEELLTIGKPVIVVLHNGSPVELPWADKVQGILEAYLGGEGVGEAVLEILYGRVNPSGKLAESFPLRLSDNPSYLNFPGKEQHVNYAEGVFVGYRWYDSKEMPVRYPFGYGLSYTTFSYSDLKIGKAPLPASCSTTSCNAGQTSQSTSDDTPEIVFTAPGERLTFGPHDLVAVSLNVTNTGSVAGREIVQLYVSDKTGAQVRPVHELKDFASVSLEPGETKTVVMLLDYRSFAWYDVDQPDWYAANGLHELQIARSSRDIEMCAEVELAGNKVKYPRIDRDVMLGDLLACDKTAGYIREKLAEPLAALGGEKPEGLNDMANSMIRYLPLHGASAALSTIPTSRSTRSSTSHGAHRSTAGPGKVNPPFTPGRSYHDTCTASLRDHHFQCKFHERGRQDAVHLAAEPLLRHQGAGGGDRRGAFPAVQPGHLGDPRRRGVSGLCPTGGGAVPADRIQIHRQGAGKKEIQRLHPALHLCGGRLCGAGQAVRHG